MPKDAHPIDNLAKYPTVKKDSQKVVVNVVKSYPMSLQLRPATRPYLASVTFWATAAIVLTALVKVVDSVPVILAENWLTDVVAVAVLVLIGEKALLFIR